MSQRKDIHKVLIIGSGPIIIGQACEFDYSGTQACKALRNLGYEIVLVNSNPATIMTDPSTADVTYIEPLNVDRLTEIIAKERPDALLPNLGGQSGLNLCEELYHAGVLDKYNVEVIGVQVDAISRGEDRIEFKNAMDKLGIEMAKSAPAYSVEEALKIAEELGYPCVIRPAYTMGGTGGGIVYNEEELKKVYLSNLKNLLDNSELWTDLGLCDGRKAWTDEVGVLEKTYQDAQKLKTLESKNYCVSGKKDNILTYLQNLEEQSIFVEDVSFTSLQTKSN